MSMLTTENESVKVRIKSVRRLLVRSLRVVLLVYLVVLIMLASLQRKLMYAPLVSDQLAVGQHAELLGLFPAAKDVQITAADGVQIQGWHLRQSDATSAEPQRPLMLFFHGNAGNRLGRMGWYRLFRDFEVDVLAIDYRGYGDSEGSPSEVGLHADAAATWNYAVNTLGYAPEQICVMGVSLGGAVAVNLVAAKSQQGTPVGGLIVVATFSSMHDTAAFLYPWLPVRWLLIDKYASDELISSVTCPVLGLHGDQDQLVPLQLGQRLFEAAPAASATGLPKKFVVMPGVGHRSLADAGERFYKDNIPQFLDAAGITIRSVSE